MKKEIQEEILEEEVASTQKTATEKRKRKFKILLLVEVIAAVLILAAGYLAIRYFKIKDTVSYEATGSISVNTDAELESHFQEISEKYTLIMLYGIDARSNSESDLYVGGNADTEIICCINNETGDVKLVSVHRDTFTKTTQDKKGKLTDFYAAYGVEESLSTINMNFDLNITKFVSVNWKALVRAIDILGGIDVELTSGEIKSINKYSKETAKITGETRYVLEAEPGLVHLDGVQAVAYARTRNVAKTNDEGVTEHDDIARASRQRIVLEKMLELVKEQVSLSLLDEFEEKVLPYVGTNCFDYLSSLFLDAGKYSIAEQTMMPFDGMYINQEKLSTAYIYCNTLEENVQELHSILFGDTSYTVSSKVQELSEYITEYRHEHP